jgi:hypothetical protein
VTEAKSAAGAVVDRAKDVGTAVKETAGAVTGAAAEEAAGAAVGTARSKSGATVPSLNLDPTTADTGAPQGVDPDKSSPAASAAPTTPMASQANAFVPSPARNGSTGAPLPRWVAYIWPAVALGRQYFEDLAGRWAQASSRLATGESGAAAAGQGVAGVHASGGNQESSDSSLFSKIPSPFSGGFYSSTATKALTYLLLAALAVIAVALVVRREVVVGRRERGQ